MKTRGLQLVGRTNQFLASTSTVIMRFFHNNRMKDYRSTVLNKKMKRKSRFRPVTV